MFTVHAPTMRTATAVRARASPSTRAQRAPCARSRASLRTSHAVVRTSRAVVTRAESTEDAGVESSASSSASASAFDGFSTAPVAEDAARLADMVAEIKDYLKLLYVKREMSFNEVKLTIGIEDPRLAENRARYGIEDESGVSGEEKVETLEMIERGETPTDMMAVETVLQEFRNWPGLDSSDRPGERVDAGPSRYEEIAMKAAGINKTQNPRRIAAKEEQEEEREGTIFGFLPLYLLNAFPIFITIAALGIMFVNSLQ